MKKVILFWSREYQKKKYSGTYPNVPQRGVKYITYFQPHCATSQWHYFLLVLEFCSAYEKLPKERRAQNVFEFMKWKKNLCALPVYILVIVQNATIFSVLVWLVFVLLMSQYFAWIRILTETHFENFCSYRDK